MDTNVCRDEATCSTQIKTSWKCTVHVHAEEWHNYTPKVNDTSVCPRSHYRKSSSSMFETMKCSGNNLICTSTWGALIPVFIIDACIEI